MTDSIVDELADLRVRVERCEAIEACRSRFNEYLYYLDGGHLEKLIDLPYRLEARRWSQRSDLLSWRSWKGGIRPSE